MLVGGAEVAPAAGVGEPTVGPMGGIGEPTVSELGVVAGDTCHLDIIDRWGNMVSATPSGGWLQSSPVIPELGFCLGTRLQMSWLDERAAVEPRPRQAAAQHAVADPWRSRTASRSWRSARPGGDGQDQWSTQLFLHHVHHGMNLQEAIDCPEFNTEPRAELVLSARRRTRLAGLEGRFPRRPARAPADAAIGCASARPGPAGRLTACAREETPDGVILKAGANPRGMQTYAVGR